MASKFHHVSVPQSPRCSTSHANCLSAFLPTPSVCVSQLQIKPAYTFALCTTHPFAVLFLLRSATIAPGPRASNEDPAHRQNGHRSDLGLPPGPLFALLGIRNSGRPAFRHRRPRPQISRSRRHRNPHKSRRPHQAPLANPRRTQILQNHGPNRATRHYSHAPRRHHSGGQSRPGQIFPHPPHLPGPWSTSSRAFFFRASRYRPRRPTGSLDRWLPLDPPQISTTGHPLAARLSLLP